MSNSNGTGLNFVRRLCMNRSMCMSLLLQSGQGTSQRDLPDILRPFAAELAVAQAAEPSLKTKKFSQLYIHILLQLMGGIQRPLVVVIDDADRLDGASMATLRSLGIQHGLNAEGGVAAIPCAIIMACKSVSSMTYKPFDAGSTEISRCPSRNISHQSGVTLLSLPPLDMDSIGGLAKMVLRCEAISSELADFIYSASPCLHLIPHSSVSSYSCSSETRTISSTSLLFCLSSSFPTLLHNRHILALLCFSSFASAIFSSWSPSFLLIFNLATGRKAQVPLTTRNMLSTTKSSVCSELCTRMSDLGR